MAYAVDAQGKKTSGGGGGGGGSSFADVLNGIVNAITGSMAAAGSAAQNWYEDVSSGGGDGYDVGGGMAGGEYLPSYMSPSQPTYSLFYQQPDIGLSQPSYDVDENKRMQTPKTGGEEEPASYWDKVESENMDLAKRINKGLEEPLATPAALSPDVKIEKSSNAYKPGEGDTNAWGEPYKENPENTYSGAPGNTRLNDRYESLFASGFNGETDVMPRYELETMHENSGRDLLHTAASAILPMGTGVVDDGTMDYEHLTSPKVLGSQLKLYARNGMAPGMDANDIEQIDPDAIYDKLELSQDENVRFTPYIPDDRTWLDTMVMAAPNEISNLTHDVAHARENISAALNPYTIEYDNGRGGKYEINGPEFDDTAFNYKRSIDRDAQYNPDRFFDTSHKNGGSWSQYARRWTTVNPSGEEEAHYGSFVPDDEGNVFRSNHDNTYTIEFDDGSSMVTTEDYLRSIVGDDGKTHFDYDQNGYLIPNAEGQVERHPPANISSISNNKTGTWSVKFSDGSTAVMTPDYIESLEKDEATGNPKLKYEGEEDVTDLGLNTWQMNGRSIPKAGNGYDAIGNAASWWMPDYVMDDGTRLSYTDVMALTNDQNDGKNEYVPEGGSIGYNWHGGGVTPIPNLPVPVLGSMNNKPSRLMSEPFEIDENGVNWNQLLSSITDDGFSRVTDLTLGSAPIMIPITQYPTSIANGLLDLRYGLSSDTYNPMQGGYSYIRGELDPNGVIRPTETDAQRLTSSMLSMGVPITENAVGPIGDTARGELGILRTSPFFTGPGLKNALGRWGVGTAAEGFEEIGGNFWDQLRNQGMSNAYGNYLSDFETLSSLEQAAERREPGSGDAIWDSVGSFHGVSGDELKQELSRLPDQLVIVPEESLARRDATGKAYRDESTPLPDRMYNATLQKDAIEDNVNGFIGGAAISALPNAVSERQKLDYYNNVQDRLGEMGDSLKPWNDPVATGYKRAPEHYLEQWR